jgi:hypothetical protein
MKRFFINFFFLLVWASRLFADTVILKNRTVYKGKVISQNEQGLVFKTREGQEISFQKKAILKVLYKDLNEVEVKKVIQEEEKVLEVPAKKVEKEIIPEKKEVVEEVPKPPELQEIEKRHWFQITWRSALLPGWGQYKAGRKWEAGLVFVTSLVAVNLAIQGVFNFQSAESDYKRKSLLTPVLFNDPQSLETNLVFSFVYNSNIYSSFQSEVTNSNNQIGLLGLAYLLQLFHSVYVGKIWEKEVIQTTSRNFFLTGWNFQFYSYLGNQNFSTDREAKIFYTFVLQ